MTRYQLSELTMQLISLTTPRRLSAIFPIDKKYDGEKYEIKDYFSTVQMIKDHGWDERISDAFNFLWDYENRHLRHYLTQYLSLVSDIRRTQGHPGILEEWAAEKGIPLYHMHEDSKGRRYLLDGNGRSIRARKQYPNYLKLVKRKRRS